MREHKNSYGLSDKRTANRAKKNELVTSNIRRLYK